jgi:hypothetical protein
MCGAGIPIRWRTGAGVIFLLKESNHGIARKPDPLMDSPHTGTSLLSVFALASATVAAAADLPTPDEYRGNWPRFRSADGGGVAKGDVQLTFDVKTGANIAWSVAVPASVT